MSEKVLSQEEINALLNAVGHDSGGKADGPATASSKSRTKEDGPERVGFLFPMAKASELGKEVEGALSLIFDAFAHKSSASFSNSLRTQVAFRIHEIEQVYYGDFVESLPEPSSIWYLSVKPLTTHIVVCLEPELVTTLVSVLLGGANHPPLTKGRTQITDLEQSIIEDIVTIFGRELRHAWSRIFEVDFEIDNRETRPRLLRIYPPTELMVTLRTTMKVGTEEASIYWGIPGGLLKTLQDSVSHQRQIESRGHLVQVLLSVKTLANQFSTGIHAELSSTPISVADLLSLEAGQVLRLEHPVCNPSLIWVNGRQKFTGEIVVSNDRRAVRVVDAISPIAR